MRYRGRAHVFGDDIDTDLIIPARFLVTTDPSELALGCMAGISPGFAQRVKHGDIVVAGRNFGCGSSREHAPLALLGCGVGCVVAASFARIFFRNAINVGLPLAVCDARDLGGSGVCEGDELEVDLTEGTLANLTRGTRASFKPLPGFALDILAAGGLVSYTVRQMRSEIPRAAGLGVAAAGWPGVAAAGGNGSGAGGAGHKSKRGE